MVVIMARMGVMWPTTMILVMIMMMLNMMLMVIIMIMLMIMIMMMLIMKGADNLDKAGLAQGDISTYYDSLNGLRIAKWIATSGARDALFWASASYGSRCSQRYVCPLVARALFYWTAAPLERSPAHEVQ